MGKKRMGEAAKKRVRAGRLLQKGKAVAAIALDAGVARQTVYSWKATSLLFRLAFHERPDTPERTAAF